ncbi:MULTISPECIES: hypothetical protein [Halorubrum]|uniref:Uncharacterized protein n=1 Tax=Halorubrum sodomense TaxID=35743 RepID=A0A1I6HVE4_HALSD|nr:MULTISPECIES: hypothetical protein [Halorubrum]SFR58413.1 hypothetical protein SAMN04487937_2907 [Halorubrum sodomense]
MSSFRRAVPLAPAGDGPRPDATAFAPTRRTTASNRTAPEQTAPNRTAPNQTADDAATQ